MTPKKLDFDLDTDEMLVEEKLENLPLVDLDVIDIDMQDSTDLLNEITHLLPSKQADQFSLGAHSIAKDRGISSCGQ